MSICQHRFCVTVADIEVSRNDSRIVDCCSRLYRQIYFVPAMLILEIGSRVAVGLPRVSRYNSFLFMHAGVFDSELRVL
jgi:hypothetical protein